MLLFYYIKWFEGVSMMFLAPESTLMADTVLAGFTVDTHLLMVDIALCLLGGGRSSNFLLNGMKIVQHLTKEESRILDLTTSPTVS